MPRYPWRKKEPAVKRLIDGLLYDTEKARLLHKWISFNDPCSLYITKSGRYFLVFEPVPEGSTPSLIDPYIYAISKEDVIARLAYDGQHDALLKLFGDEVEEA